MDDILEKVITTSSIGAAGGGLLKPQQTNRFIDYIFDNTVLSKESRTERINGTEAELERIHVGRRLLRGATEAVDDHVNAGVTFSKISMRTSKLRLDWELSRESLEDNLEGADLEDHIAQLMSRVVGNDIEDMAINGDALSADPFLRNFDGWRKLAKNNATVISADGRPLNQYVFQRMLRAMPRTYMQRRNELRFYTGSSLIQDYLFALSMNGPEAMQVAALSGQGPGAGLDGQAGSTYPYAFGVPVREVPLYETTLDGTYTVNDDDDDGTTPEVPAEGDHGEIDLTFPNNRIIAIRRAIEVFREFKPKKDSIEYTVFMRAGVEIEDTEAWVHMTNVKVREGFGDEA